MKRICFLTILLSLLCSSDALTQPSRVLEGNKMPDITINNIEYYSSQAAKLSEFRGKWVVLDFWHKYCKGCYFAMPHTDSLQRLFKEKVQFLMVGRQDPENEIRRAYEKYREKYQLQLSVAYDSNAHKELGVSACPVIFIIDTGGILRAKTTKIVREDLEQLMQGKKILTIKPENEKGPVDRKKPLLINGNGGSNTDFLFRSVLAKGSAGLKSVQAASITSDLQSTGMFQVTNASVMDLYIYAYFNQFKIGANDTLYGKVSRVPILKVSDSSVFHCDYARAKNLFSYSLIVPPSRRKTEDVMQIMRSDLQNYFKFNVTVEKRKMPYWKLTATEEARKRVATKGGLRSIQGLPSESNGFKVTNYEPGIIVFQIWAFNQFDIPIVDETGITGNIDFSIEAVFTDLESVRQALCKQGFNLERSEKEMNVLVFRDQ